MLKSALLAWATLIFTCAAYAAEPVGSAVRIVNRVTGSLDQQQRSLAVGDGVSQNETVEVAADSLGELRLLDDTKLALGPGSRLVLDKFVYNPSASTGAISVDLVKGAFRFITGLTRKRDYQLRTPSASITVRGTIFDVYVDAQGGTWLLLLEGSVRVCNTSGQCSDVSNPCGVVHITATGTLDGPQGWPAQTRPINFATAFPFVVTPPSIDSRPLFTRTAVEQNQCGAPPQIPTQRAEVPQTPSPSKTPIPQEQAYTPPPPPPRSYDNEPSQPYTPVTPPVIVSRSFNGAYVGVVAGAAWQQSKPFLDCSDFTNPDPSVCSTAASFLIPADAFNLGDTGFLGGGQIGYNFSFGNIVLGIEADIAYTSLSTTSSFDQVFAFGCCTIIRGSAMHQELSSLSTVRGRLGYTFDNILLYATGGLALGQVDYAFELNWPDIGGFAQDESSKLAAGYTLGAGVEIALGQWSLKTEYLFYDLGSESLTAPFLINGAPEPFIFRPEFTTQGHIIRIGTNFSLN
jgi:opacity protein-like surface antigen